MRPLLSSCGGRDCDDAGRFAALVRPPLRILRGRAERLRRHHPGGRAAPVADPRPVRAPYGTGIACRRARSAVGSVRYSGYGCRCYPCEGSMALLCPARDTEHTTARARGTGPRINFQSPPSSATLPEGEIMDAARDGLFHWSDVPLGPGAAVRETHSAVVVLLGDRAYKIKKPVDLGFLDFRSVESRREACHRELALNRRMTPDVYIGVADVTGADGAPCEHVLVMHRMPDESRLALLVRNGVEVRSDLRQLARVCLLYT